MLLLSHLFQKNIKTNQNIRGGGNNNNNSNKLKREKEREEIIRIIPEWQDTAGWRQFESG